jgi:hypothetical protein
MSKTTMLRRREEFHSSRAHVGCQQRREKKGGCHFEAKFDEENVSAKPQKASQQARFSRPYEIAKRSQDPRPAASAGSC